MESSGRCDDRFAGVRSAFEANFEAGTEHGASLAVTLDGELVVDLWGGDATGDDGADRPWERDTIVNVWSTTKTMTAICCLMLADRGELDLDAPVADVLARVRRRRQGVRDDEPPAQPFRRSPGLVGADDPGRPLRLGQGDRAASPRRSPWWEPGTASGYHAITQGYLLGEVVRRVSGRTVGHVLRRGSGVAARRRLPHRHGAKRTTRAGHVIPPEPDAAAFGNANEITIRALSNPPMDASAANTIPWRRAEIPAAGGFGNARAVATVHAAIACGGSVDGVTLMSPEGCERIFDEQINGQDLILPAVLRLGSGFGLVSEAIPVGPNPRTCFWGGWGGSLAVIDLDARMSVAYVMDKMSGGTMGDLRAAGPLMAAHAAVATPG
ncbi:MAG: serine hydrolase domain-containing protein [Ilumatobacteraceae bacterium]